MGLFSSPAPQRAARPFRTCTIVGSPGMGKTALTEEWIDAWRKERQGRGVLAILDPGRQFRHLGPCASFPGEDDGDDDRAPDIVAALWIKAIVKARAGAGDSPPMLIVLDDADVYLSGGQPRGVWRRFFMQFRHLRCDVIASGRRPQELPKVLFQNSTIVACFATTEPYAVEYLRGAITPKNTKQIPNEPFKYLSVDMLSKESEVLTTKKRVVLVAADRA